MISIKIPEILAISPVVLMISFLIMQGVIGAEVARYGISSIFGKLKKVLS